jgi:tripeptidyl-peptidase-1
VSDPTHQRYGKHLTADEVNELVKPTDLALDLVIDWLAEHGIERHRLDFSPAKDWISVPLPVSTAERLLDTKYSVYKHEDGSHVVRTPEWSLPLHLHKHIVSVQPTNSFLRASPKKVNYKPAGGKWKYPADTWTSNQPTIQNPTVAQVCNTSGVTPLCLRTLYNTVNYKPQVPGKNKVALNNFLSETNNRSEVEIFLEKYRPDAAGFKFDINVINGGDNQQTPNTPAQNAAGKDLEGNLDAETIIGIVYPTPLIAYNTGGEPPFNPDLFAPTNTNEPYMAWLNYILSQPDIPQTISTSYADDEQTVPLSYATAVCQQFAQLGARGVSVLFASGDNGVGADPSCVSNDGTNRTAFLPEFPPACPYVTVVGATKDFAPEVAAYDSRNGFASGGGYSNYFARPPYQKSAVDAYTAALGTQFAGLYNTTGRAYPDIAAQGQRLITIWNGNVTLLDGTSAATPAAAAVIALVNDALIAAGKAPLGFLNPWLYQGGWKAFNDVTSGSALGCGTSGFPAAKGWDAVTGWGTPDFLKIKDAVLQGGYGLGW